MNTKRVRWSSHKTDVEVEIVRLKKARAGANLDALMVSEDKGELWGLSTLTQYA